MRDNADTVFVTDADTQLLAAFKSDPAKTDVKARIMTAGDEDFKVTGFDVNALRLETNFQENIFLLYSDSYNSGWKAFINGKPDRVYQANAAFKGIWVPPGPAAIELKYAPPAGAEMYILTIVFSFVFLFLTLWVLYRERGPQRAKEEETAYA